MLVPSCYVNGLDQHQTVENMAATALTWRWNGRLALIGYLPNAGSPALARPAITYASLMSMEVASRPAEW